MSEIFCIFGQIIKDIANIQFKYYNQGQGELFPSYIGEKIPVNHPVRLLSGIVDALDITELVETYVYIIHFMTFMSDKSNFSIAA